MALLGTGAMGSPGTSSETSGQAFESIQRPDLVGLVEAQLLQAILDGRLAPGAKIVEAALARQMGISRAPVREAARRLESQGVLVSRPRHGFAVRNITAKQVDDLYRVRVHLEIMAVRVACVEASDEQLAGLRPRFDEMVSASARVTRSQRVALDMGFHAYLCEISGNSYLQRLFDQLQTEVQIILALTEDGYNGPEALAKTHEPIVAALLNRDADAAEAALRFHLDDGHVHARAMF